MEQTYNEMLIQHLTGRRLQPAFMPAVHFGRPQFRFWGADAGIPEGDIHQDRLYRIWLTYDPESLRIEAAQVFVDGELISPCSGFRQEALDEFDYPQVLEWCLTHTDP